MILAGPWVGEFGWELFSWQGKLRALSVMDDVICVIREGQEFLYEDFAKGFIFHDITGLNRDSWQLDYKNYKLKEEWKHEVAKRYGDITYFEPTRKYLMGEQKFIKYASNGDNYDIVFHCRSETKLKTDYRNWPLEKWAELASYFRSLKVACVGLSDTSSCIEGTDDLRNLSLQQLAGVLSNAKLLVGQSSGVGHYASLCGCPHIVWTSWTRKRWETEWNPFGTPVTVIDSKDWNPDVDLVKEMIWASLKN